MGLEVATESVRANTRLKSWREWILALNCCWPWTVTEVNYCPVWAAGVEGVWCHLPSGVIYPLPSNRHHQSNGDCLEGRRENYQVCSVQYCVQQLCTEQCTQIWTDLTVLWIGFCLTGPISLFLDSFLYVYHCMNQAMGYTKPLGM